ncbi:WYL domain-containing protein [Fusibacter sp. 3D3]|uniref:WYL domain-containing protein n=1 Tax=Fusibacter sp. 3D3 TaxID=1048380 RepID=UPI000853D5D7|nr:WYL domain-containing protein [Fusibacter sp. 3D3]GAU79965.1 hypothetical protein F3D3_4630 [Fusibacter sp. 3D3]
MRNINLYNIYKNKMFSVTTFIINDILNQGSYTKKELEDSLQKMGFNENLFFDDIVDSKSEIFDLNDGLYSPKSKKMVPIIPSLQEKEWLKMILTAPEIKLFLPENLINTLDQALSDFPENLKLSNFEFKSTHETDDPLNSVEFIETFQTLLKAILGQKIIGYDYVAQDGTYFKSQSSIPYKIEYSKLNAKFRLFMFSLTNHKPVKVNISQLKTLWIQENNFDYSKEIIEAEVLSCKSQSPIILEIDNISYIMERCFSMFSHYEKESYFDSQKNKFIIELQYYLLDEAELIKDILSFGSHILVIEPQHIRKRIVERIEQCMG